MSSIPKSAKLDQVLILEPKHELHFKGPYTELVMRHIKLTNPSDRSVCFKVKTTAPKRYCVRPNNGIIEPKATTSVAVILQPFDVENQLEKNKHKFMVQSIFAPDEPFDNQDALWKEANPEQIMDSKLKCVFDSPNQNSESDKPQVTTSSSNYTSLSNPPQTEMERSITDEKVNSSSDERSFIDENKKLRDEVSKLQGELWRLKEDLLVNRRTAAVDKVKPFELPAQSPKTAGTTDLDLSMILNPQVIALGLVIFCFGMLVGKVLF